MVKRGKRRRKRKEKGGIFIQDVVVAVVVGCASI